MLVHKYCAHCGEKRKDDDILVKGVCSSCYGKKPELIADGMTSMETLVVWEMAAQRIEKLESEVAGLHETIFAIEHRLNCLEGVA